VEIAFLCQLRQYYSGEQRKEDEIGGACSKHYNMRNACCILVLKHEGTWPLERPRHWWYGVLNWTL